MLHKVAELELQTPKLLMGLGISVVIVYCFYYLFVHPSNLLLVSGIYGGGIFAYFLYTFQLFRQFNRQYKK